MEKYLPFYHQVSSSEQEQLMIDHKLSLELYQELIRTMYIKSYDSVPHDSRGSHTVAKIAKRDTQLIE